MLASILNSFVGDFLNIGQLDLSIWNGDFALENVEIRPWALHKLGLPFRVVAGNVGKLVIKLPWKNLQSMPVEFVLSDLRVIAVPDSNGDPNGGTADTEADDVDERFQEKMADMKRYEDWSEANAAANTTSIFPFPLSLPSFAFTDFIFSPTDQLISLITRNLKVVIERIHVRFEEEASREGQHGFSFGLVMESVKLEATNANWEPSFVRDEGQGTTIHKAVTLQGFAVYLNTEIGTANSHRRPLPRLSASNEDKLAILRGLDTRAGILDFIIQPIFLSVHLALTQNPAKSEPPFSVPETVVELVLEKFAMGLSQSQLHSTIRLVHSLEPTGPEPWPVDRFRKLRPAIEKCTGRCRYKLLWKYAFNCAKQLKRSRYHWSHIKEYRHKYKKYTEFQFRLLLNEELGSVNEAHLHTYERELDLINLVLGRCQAQLEFEREQKLEHAAGTGWVDTLVQKNQRLAKAVARRIHEPWNAEEKKRIRETIDFYSGNETPLAAATTTAQRAPTLPANFIRQKIGALVKQFEVFSIQDATDAMLHVENIEFGVQLHPNPNEGLKLEARVKSVHVTSQHGGRGSTVPTEPTYLVSAGPPPHSHTHAHSHSHQLGAAGTELDAETHPHVVAPGTRRQSRQPGHAVIHSKENEPPTPTSPTPNALELTFEIVPGGRERVAFSLGSTEFVNHSEILTNFQRLAREKGVKLQTDAPTDPAASLRFGAAIGLNALLVYPYLVLEAMSMSATEP